VTSVAIMQPYFLPYLGYWQLIANADLFVIYDNVKFTKNGWFHRNNIVLNNQKYLFTLPIRKDSDFLHVIDRYLAENVTEALNKLLRQIENQYKNAPFFFVVLPLLKRIFFYDEKNLFKFLFHSVQQVCDYLQVKTPLLVSSEIEKKHGLKSQDRVIALCQALDSTHYINPIGGLSLYQNSAFEKKGIQLSFLNSLCPTYPQNTKEFISHLSIIDILMFNSVEDIQSMLTKFTLVSGYDNEV
jgi:hypothetical protein